MKNDRVYLRHILRCIFLIQNHTAVGCNEGLTMSYSCWYFA
jgi:hypothetical protein